MYTQPSIIDARYLQKHLYAHLAPVPRKEKFSQHIILGNNKNPYNQRHLHVLW